MKRNLSPSILWILPAVVLIAAAPSQAGVDAPPGEAIIEHYLAIHAALAGDSVSGLSSHAAALGELAARRTGTDPDGEQGAELLKRVAAEAELLSRADDLEEARKRFGVLSESLLEAGDALLGPARGLKTAYCAMADRHWLQAADRIENPYYGSAMLRCGGFVEGSQAANPSK